MSVLQPYPFGALVRRMFHELRHSDAIFGLHRSKFFRPSRAADVSVRFHGRLVQTPLGPAAGPHTQMAQNIVLAYLAGCRVMELKTTQILDTLDIPRPCIDMRTVGYNVEWSQELKLEQSLEEYVKAAMLIEMLVRSGELGPDFELAHGSTDPGAGIAYDMSVGYDLAGIKSPRVAQFIRGMQDASAAVERLRDQIPDELAALRGTTFGTRLSDTLTLSTFHGCPPNEIDRIVEHLQNEHRLHCIVKLNPTLLGPERMRQLLSETMGYAAITVPQSAFDNDPTWDEVDGLVKRRGDEAKRLGLGFGIKLSNTLIVNNHDSYFPATEKVMYLSGQALHVLAMNLVLKFRESFGDTYPISFSGGIDRHNFADGVALGLVPVTACSDLLRTGGYARATAYLGELDGRMKAVGARTIDEFILRAYGNARAALARLKLMADSDAMQACERAMGGEDLTGVPNEVLRSWLAEAKILNTRHYVEQATIDSRYGAAKNQKPPKKVGSKLELFDCLTCDKCLPVCPNNANFILPMPTIDIPIAFLRREGAAAPFVYERQGSVRLEKKHQIANYRDFCNDCGNCDVFCPEDGGPYVVKPRFFGESADFHATASGDGFYFEQRPFGQHALARFAGRVFEIEVDDGAGVVHYCGPGFDIRFQSSDVGSTVSGGSSQNEIDLTYFYIVDAIRRAIYSSATINYVNMR